MLISAQQPAYTPRVPFPLWGTDHETTAEGTPTLTLYPAQGEPTGAAMVVCPGGGYEFLAPHEGETVAEWLATLGITAAVLHYRIAPRHSHPAMLDDGLCAVRTLRERAGEWGIDPRRIGIAGFSAGGHLAACVATMCPDSDARPDLAVLIYPVITMADPHTHEGSRRNLLGDAPSADLIAQMSAERRVTRKTPPCFLVHTVDDDTVPVENSLSFSAALRGAGVPFEMHLYEHGPHGFGLGGDDPVLSTWPERCAAWLRRHGFARR